MMALADEVNALENIEKLEDGECWVWPESDYGKAEVWYKNGVYFLFANPIYGGEPQYIEWYTIATICYLIKKVESWT